MSRKQRVIVPSPRPVAMGEIQLINRVEEMHVLREAADSATRGEGGVVFELTFSLLLPYSSFRMVFCNILEVT